MPIIFTTLSSPTAWVYPKECNLCSKFRVQCKSKKFEPYKIPTYDAERMLKAAAKATDYMQKYQVLTSLLRNSRSMPIATKTLPVGLVVL